MGGDEGECSVPTRLTLLWNGYTLCSAVIPNSQPQNMPYRVKSETPLAVSAPSEDEYVPLERSYSIRV